MPTIHCFFTFNKEANLDEETNRLRQAMKGGPLEGLPIYDGNMFLGSRAAFFTNSPAKAIVVNADDPNGMADTLLRPLSRALDRTFIDNLEPSGFTFVGKVRPPQTSGQPIVYHIRF